jgi:hypothetical protein
VPEISPQMIRLPMVVKGIGNQSWSLVLPWWYTFRLNHSPVFHMTTCSLFLLWWFHSVHP